MLVIVFVLIIKQGMCIAKKKYIAYVIGLKEIWNTESMLRCVMYRTIKTQTEGGDA